MKELSVGKHEIDDGNIFVLAQDYEAKEASESILMYQYIVSDSEYIGYAPLADQKVVLEYNEGHDYGLYKGEASFVKVAAGMFAIFFSSDLHMHASVVRP